MTAWLGGFLALCLRIIAKTWRTRGFEDARAAIERSSGGPVLVAFWHEDYVPLFSLMQGIRAKVFVAEGFRGEVISSVCERFGFEPILLSRTDRARALDEMTSAIASGVPCATAIDGPLGPRRCAKYAVVRLAIENGARVLPVGARVRPRMVLVWRWDRRVLPLPFARIDARIGAPIELPPRAGDADVIACSDRISRAIDAVGPTEGRARRLARSRLALRDGDVAPRPTRVTDGVDR